MLYPIGYLFTLNFCNLLADIRNDIEKSEVIGPNDMLIASIVKFHEGILVTNNVKKFERIKGLKIENWAK